MSKYHTVFKNNSTLHLGFLCRLINFLEDVLEDAECGDIYVSEKELVDEKIVLEPINCTYDVGESIEVFSEEYDLDNIVVGSGDTGLSSLYDYLVNYYRETLHYKMLELAGRTLSSGYEYYLGILFNGSAFILEGEKDHVTLPGIKHCFSAHTHPSQIPVPSSMDLKMITRLLIDRGIGHVVVASTSSLAIYRVKPLTLEDLEYLKTLNYTDPVKALQGFSHTSSIRIRYL